MNEWQALLKAVAVALGLCAEQDDPGRLGVRLRDANYVMEG